MSLSTELQRIRNAKSALQSTINNHGGTLTSSNLLGDYPAQVESILTKFYRCASVNTSANTWTGYLWTLSGGIYTMAATATTGLTYTSVTPEVGKDYTADALIECKSFYTGGPAIPSGIPTTGLLAYYDFAANGLADYTDNGYDATQQGSVTLDSNGASGFSDSNYLKLPAATHPSGDFTVAGKFYLDSFNYYTYPIWGMNTAGASSTAAATAVKVGIWGNDSIFNTLRGNSGGSDTLSSSAIGRWISFCAPSDGSRYVNASSNGNGFGGNIGAAVDDCLVGYMPASWAGRSGISYFFGKIQKLSFWSRALSSSECEAVCTSMGYDA